MGRTKLAFALAGLGGFNAHGAAFLQAARDNEIEPDLVTATSGQIVVLAAYLEGATDRIGLIDKSLEDNPFAQLRIALLGYTGVFAPAVAEGSRGNSGTSLFRDWPGTRCQRATTREGRFLDFDESVRRGSAERYPENRNARASTRARVMARRSEQEQG
jgi:hypothetical protein